MAEKLKLEVSDEIAIKIQSMNKWFGSFHVLRDIDLTVNSRFALWHAWCSRIYAR